MTTTNETKATENNNLNNGAEGAKETKKGPTPPRKVFLRDLLQLQQIGRFIGTRVLGRNGLMDLVADAEKRLPRGTPEFQRKPLNPGLVPDAVVRELEAVFPEGQRKGAEWAIKTLAGTGKGWAERPTYQQLRGAMRALMDLHVEGIGRACNALEFPIERDVPPQLAVQALLDRVGELLGRGEAGLIVRCYNRADELASDDEHFVRPPEVLAIGDSVVEGIDLAQMAQLYAHARKVLAASEREANERVTKARAEAEARRLEREKERTAEVDRQRKLRGYTPERGTGKHHPPRQS